MKKTILTQRETEVLAHLAAGKSYQEIAEVYFISKETVHKHLTQAYKKLGAENGVNAVAIAIRTGVIG